MIQVIGRKAERDGNDDNNGIGAQADENEDGECVAEESKGAIIPETTSAPQNIRFLTDASLLNEAREKGYVEDKRIMLEAKHCLGESTSTFFPSASGK